MRRYRMDDQTWAASSNRLIKCSMLPPGRRILNILLHLEISGTKDSGDVNTQALADSGQFALAISSIKLGRLVNVTGLMLHQLNRIIFGRVVGGSTAVTGSGTTWSATVDLVVPFNDPRRVGSSDRAIPTELIKDKALEVTFAGANPWAIGNFVITAGTLRVDAELILDSGIPEIAVLGYEDPGALSWALTPGIYSDAWLNDGAGLGTITPAEVSAVDLTADGEAILNNALHQQLTAAFNIYRLHDTAAALAFAGADFLPLLTTPARNAHLTKAVAVEKNGQIQLTGTISAPRFCYWRTEMKDQATVEQIARVTGAPASASSYEPQVASKSAVRSQMRAEREGRPATKKSRLLYSALPGKLRTTPTPGNK